MVRLLDSGAAPLVTFLLSHPRVRTYIREVLSSAVAKAVFEAKRCISAIARSALEAKRRAQITTICLCRAVSARQDIFLKELLRQILIRMIFPRKRFLRGSLGSLASLELNEELLLRARLDVDLQEFAWPSIKQMLLSATLQATRDLYTNLGGAPGLSVEKARDVILYEMLTELVVRMTFPRLQQHSWRGSFAQVFAWWSIRQVMLSATWLASRDISKAAHDLCCVSRAERRKRCTGAKSYSSKIIADGCMTTSSYANDNARNKLDVKATVSGYDREGVSFTVINQSDADALFQIPQGALLAPRSHFGQQNVIVRDAVREEVPAGTTKVLKAHGFCGNRTKASPSDDFVCTGHVMTFDLSSQAAVWRVTDSYSG